MLQKFTLLTCSVFIILFSCKKNNNTISSNAVLSRIKLIHADSVGGSESFVFDNDNRIAEVKSSFAGNTSTVAAIGYEAGKIVITPVHSGVKESSQVIYSIDGNSMPQLRTSYDSIDFTNVGITQRDYTYDTTQYFYNAAGLIIKKIYSKKDSTYFDPGSSPQIIIDITQFESDYMYTGEFLNSVTRNAQHSTNTFSIVYSNVVTEKDSQLETWNFDDTKNFPNKWDYKNQVVINELGFLPDIFVIGDISKINSDLPSAYQYSSVSKDENGSIIRSDNSGKRFDFSYSGSFMSSTAEDGSLAWEYEYK